MKSVAASAWQVKVSVAIAVIGFAFVLHASYPGYPSPDSISQAEQALSGGYHDWHSPFVAVLWALLLGLKMDPTLFIAFNNLLIWAGTLGFALAMKRKFGPGALLLLLVPLLPGTVNFLGNAIVDVLLVSWLMMGTCAAYFSRQDRFTEQTRVRLQIFANLCFAAAFLTRLNAIFALLPLLLYTNARLGLRRNLAACMVFPSSVGHRLEGPVSFHLRSTEEPAYLGLIQIDEGMAQANSSPPRRVFQRVERHVQAQYV